MAFQPHAAAENIQAIAVSIIAAHKSGYRLYLIGGFRYRRLDWSAASSEDVAYHWEGDPEQKQLELVDVLQQKLLPEIKRQFGYDGDIRPAAGPEADSTAVRIVETAFYKIAEKGSRIEIPIEITRIVRLDAPAVRTLSGTVYLTVSDADMIESKVIALLNSRYCRVRDVLDIFLFQDALTPNAPARLAQKLSVLRFPLADAFAVLDKFELDRPLHVGGIERLLSVQVDEVISVNLRAVGGGAMIWDAIMRLLRDLLIKTRAISP